VIDKWLFFSCFLHGSGCDHPVEERKES